MAAIIEVVTGKSAGSQSSVENGATCRVGRAGTSELVVDDTLLSNVHFEVRLEGERCLLRDLGSKYGTTLNGRKIDTKAGDATLGSGDTILAGNTRFRIRLEGQSMAQSSAAGHSHAGGHSQASGPGPSTKSDSDINLPPVRAAAAPAAPARPTSGFARVAFELAEEVCKPIALADPARALLKPHLTPRAYFDLLKAGGHTLDAMKLLAHALPKPEAVWWGIQCIRALPAPPGGVDREFALLAAERWVRQPSEENRQKTWEASQRADLSNSRGCIAVAAFWSGGSLVPAILAPTAAPVAPPEHLTGRAVAMALQLAGVEAEPEKAPEKYAGFLEIGVKIADGLLVW